MAKIHSSTTNRLLRQGAIACALLLLTGCGFHPVYGNRGSDSPVAEQLNQVAIESIPEHVGQMVRNDLIDDMYGKGRPGHALYQLSVKLRIEEENLGTLANATTTLEAIHLHADYVMKDSSGKQLLAGTTQSTTTFDQLASLYSTQAAHDEAIERTANEVGEQITERLSLYFSERDTKPPAP
jgi:LPS-assembly lipoprotein